jgi:hypothetical protein
MKTLREFINIIQEASGTIPNSVDQGNGIVTLGLCGPGSSVNQQNVATLNKFCDTSIKIRPENDYKYAVVDLDNKRFSVVSSEHESGQNTFSHLNCLISASNCFRISRSSFGVYESLVSFSFILAIICFADLSKSHALRKGFLSIFFAISSKRDSTSTFDIVTGFGLVSSLPLSVSARFQISDSITLAFHNSVSHFFILPSLSIRDTSSIASASCGDLTSSSFLKNHGFVSIASHTTFCFSLTHISESFGVAISSACCLNHISACEVSFCACFQKSGVRVSVICHVISPALDLIFGRYGKGRTCETFITHSIASAKFG